MFTVLALGLSGRAALPRAATKIPCRGQSDGSCSSGGRLSSWFT
jgi:hypothetical protein